MRWHVGIIAAVAICSAGPWAMAEVENPNRAAGPDRTLWEQPVTSMPVRDAGADPDTTPADVLGPAFRVPTGFVVDRLFTVP